MCQSELFNYREWSILCLKRAQRVTNTAKPACVEQHCFIYFAEVTMMTPGEDN